MIQSILQACNLTLNFLFPTFHMDALDYIKPSDHMYTDDFD